jgi:hypothetical protein
VHRAAPPVALRYSHVAFNQEFRGGGQFDGCGEDWLSKYEYAAATFVETCAWETVHVEIPLFWELLTIFKYSFLQYLREFVYLAIYSL